MKKLISLFAAVSMIIMMSANYVYAANTVVFNSNATSFEYAGDTYVTVVTSITAENGFAGFKTTLTYDKNTFEFVSASKSADLDGTLVEDTKTAGKVIHAFGSSKDLMPTVTSGFPPVTKTCDYNITYNFKIKAEAYNGSYNFVVESDPNNLRNAANEVITGDTTGATANFTVTSGKDVVTVDYAALDAAIADFGTKTETDYTAESWAAAKTAYDAAVAAKTATTQAEVDAATTALTNAIAALKTKPVDQIDVKPETTVIKKDNPSGLWTFGFGGTVEITGSKTFSKLIFTLEDTVNGKPGSYTWDFKTPINATVTYGLNIMGCPVNSNITATVKAQ